MSTATVEKMKGPVDLNPDLPLSHTGLEDFLRDRLVMAPAKIFETRAYISNVLLGRNQTPTLTDAIMAERMYQNHEFDKFSFYLEWRECDEENVWLYVRVVEREGSVPKSAAFGELVFKTGWYGGFLGHSAICSSFTRDIVSDFDGFRVFDDCQGFESDRCWPWAVRVERDIRAWAGDKMADYYWKFIDYAKELTSRKRAENVTVKLSPEPKGNPGDPEQYRLHVQVHRGPMQLGGFTTMAEFNEVITKEKNQ